MYIYVRAPWTSRRPTSRPRPSKTGCVINSYSITSSMFILLLIMHILVNANTCIIYSSTSTIINSRNWPPLETGCVRGLSGEFIIIIIISSSTIDSICIMFIIMCLLS